MLTSIGEIGGIFSEINGIVHVPKHVPKPHWKVS